MGLLGRSRDGEEMTELLDAALVGGGRFSLLLVFRAVASNFSRNIRHAGFVGGANTKEYCLVSAAKAVGRAQVSVRVIGLLSFFEKRGAHGESRPTSPSVEDWTEDLSVGAGAGSIRLSNQASILSNRGVVSGAGS